MKRALLTAAALSLATLCGAPACRANNPTSQPTTRPSTNPTRTADGRQTTGQKYQDAVRKQDQTKQALRDRVMSMSQGNAAQADVPPPPTPAEQLAEAQARLDEEVARHEARLGELRREESDARYAGDRKKAQKIRKSIEAENQAYQRTAAALRRQLRESQARVDAEARAVSQSSARRVNR